MGTIVNTSDASNQFSLNVRDNLATCGASDEAKKEEFVNEKDKEVKKKCRKYVNYHPVIATQGEKAH